MTAAKKAVLRVFCAERQVLGKPMASRVCMLSFYRGYTAVVVLEICLSFFGLVQCKQLLSTTIPSRIANGTSLIQTFYWNLLWGRYEH